MEHFELEKGLELSITRYQLAEIMRTEVEIDRPTFSFGCLLAGESEWTSSVGTRETIKTTAGNSASVWSVHDGFEFNAPAKTKLHSIAVSVTQEFLQKRCPWVSGILPLQLERAISRSDFPLAFEVRELSPVAKIAARQVLESCDSDPLRCLLLESHALTLLREQLLTLLPVKTSSDNRCLLRKNDLTKLNEIRQVLLAHPERSPRISELARLVGMNECDLKRGFRTAFGTTIYEFLRGTRMELADHLLGSRKMSVGEVAELVGYRSPSRFAVAFRERFGATPKRRQAMKN